VREHGNAQEHRQRNRLPEKIEAITVSDGRGQLHAARRMSVDEDFNDDETLWLQVQAELRQLKRRGT